VRATAVNRADLLQRRGHYPAPAGAPQHIPGLEYAGTVEQIGAGVTRWRVGDRVMGIVAGGGYAEMVCVHEDEALPVPGSLSLTEAAAIPEAFLTADDALFTLMGLQPGESVLIHAVASGVGTAAVQLVKAAGATAIGTSRSAQKLRQVHGLDHGIDASNGFADAVLALNGNGVDGVLDLVGGDYMTANLKCTAQRGRIVLVGLTAGNQALLDLGLILRKRLSIVGTVMRARSLAEKIAVATAFAQRSLPWFDGGKLKPVIDRVLSISEVREAHALLERNETVGKVVLEF
jgi:NADPH:quinone reductase